MTTNNIAVRTVGPIQVTTRRRAVQKLWGMSRCKGGSVRVDTGKRVTYFKLKPRYFWNKRFATNVAR